MLHIFHTWVFVAYIPNPNYSKTVEYCSPVYGKINAPINNSDEKELGLFRCTKCPAEKVQGRLEMQAMASL